MTIWKIITGTAHAFLVLVLRPRFPSEKDRGRGRRTRTRTKGDRGSAGFLIRLQVPMVRLIAVAWLVTGGIGIGLAAAAPSGGSTNEAAAVEWPIFRGNAQLAGVASGALPEKLALLWNFKTGEAIKSSAVIGRGRVFIGSNDNKLYALNLRDGGKLWEFNAGDRVEAPPLIVDDLVVVGTLKGTLFAVDAATGKARWQYETGGKIMGSANWIPGPGNQGKRILVGSYDNVMHCVAAATGKVVWTYETGNYINGAPAVSDGKTVFGGCDALVHVVSVADGKEIAKIEAGAYIAGSAAMVGDRVYVGHYEGQLICVDLSQKKIAWQYGSPNGGAPFFASPAVGADRVVAGSRDQSVHCVARKDGAKLWTFRTRGDVDSSPVICGDKVVVGSTDGRLYLLSLGEGRELWSYEIGAPITGSPAVAGGIVVVGTEDGRVYAFGRK